MKSLTKNISIPSNRARSFSTSYTPSFGDEMRHQNALKIYGLISQYPEHGFLLLAVLAYINEFLNSKQSLGFITLNRILVENMKPRGSITHISYDPQDPFVKIELKSDEIVFFGNHDGNFKFDLPISHLQLFNLTSHGINKIDMQGVPDELQHYPTHAFLYAIGKQIPNQIAVVSEIFGSVFHGLAVMDEKGVLPLFLLEKEDMYFNDLEHSIYTSLGKIFDSYCKIFKSPAADLMHKFREFNPIKKIFSPFLRMKIFKIKKLIDHAEKSYHEDGMSSEFERIIFHKKAKLGNIQNDEYSKLNERLENCLETIHDVLEKLARII